MLTTVVDICITTPRKELERVCLLAEALAERKSTGPIAMPDTLIMI